MEETAEELKRQIQRYEAPVDLVRMDDDEIARLSDALEADATVEQANAALQQLRERDLRNAAYDANIWLDALKKLRGEVEELWREDPQEDQPAETPEQ